MPAFAPAERLLADVSVGPLEGVDEGWDGVIVEDAIVELNT
jgi:hypothetical protein